MSLPNRSWEPPSPAITNKPGERSADALRAVVAQFDLKHERYRYNHQGGKETYCNIFLADCLLALLAPETWIHWVNKVTGDLIAWPLPSEFLHVQKVGDHDMHVPNPDKVRELSANAMCDWFVTHGPRYGWAEADRCAAGGFACRGQPTVVTWLNRGGIGHVAILLPSDGPDIRIAQAGARNFYGEALERGFPAYISQSLRYFVHG